MDQKRIDDATLMGQAFGGALVASMNLSAALLHGLVIKGLLTKEQARALIEEAANQSAQMQLPDMFANGIRDAYAKFRRGFE